MENLESDKWFTTEEAYKNLGLEWPAKRLLTLNEGEWLAKIRLEALGFQFSPTQQATPADGNCLMRALVDQIA